MNDIKVLDEQDHMAIWNKVSTVPAQFLKPIQGGRLKGKTDINPTWRLQVLTEMFGPAGFGWYYEIVDRGIQTTSDEQVSAHVLINMFVKVAGEWSKPIQGLGGSMLMEKEKAGMYHSDEAFKMALTDAISVACKSLGVASTVYMGMIDSKYRGPRPEVETDPADAVSYVQAEIKLINECRDMDELKTVYKQAYTAHSDNAPALKALTAAKDRQKRVLSVASVFNGEVTS